MGNKNERRPRGLPQATPVDGGTPDVPSPEEFLARLSPADKPTVEKIVGIVNQLSKAYNGEDVNYPGFFAVYGIGGNVTKQGERPDVDLLIVTSAYWDGGYYGEERTSGLDEDFDYSTEEGRSQARKVHGLNADWVCGSIRDQLKGEYSAEALDELPDNYNMGDGTKGLLRLSPIRNVTPTGVTETNPNAAQTDTRKSIDIVYVRTKPYISPEESGLDEYGRRTLADFETTADVDETGKPLPRVLLFKAENLGIVNMMHW